MEWDSKLSFTTITKTSLFGGTVETDVKVYWICDIEILGGVGSFFE